MPSRDVFLEEEDDIDKEIAAQRDILIKNLQKIREEKKRKAEMNEGKSESNLLNSVSICDVSIAVEVVSECNENQIDKVICDTMDEMKSGDEMNDKKGNEMKVKEEIEDETSEMNGQTTYTQRELPPRFPTGNESDTSSVKRRRVHSPIQSPSITNSRSKHSPIVWGKDESRVPSSSPSPSRLVQLNNGNSLLVQTPSLPLLQSPFISSTHPPFYPIPPSSLFIPSLTVIQSTQQLEEKVQALHELIHIKRKELSLWEKIKQPGMEYDTKEREVKNELLQLYMDWDDTMERVKRMKMEEIEEMEEETEMKENEVGEDRREENRRTRSFTEESMDNINQYDARLTMDSSSHRRSFTPLPDYRHQLSFHSHGYPTLNDVSDSRREHNRNRSLRNIGHHVNDVRNRYRNDSRGRRK